MSNRAQATVRLKFVTQKQVETLLRALSPEAKTPMTHRADIKLAQDGLFLVVSVDAKGTVALRATLNSYLRWINSAINVIDTVAQL